MLYSRFKYVILAILLVISVFMFWQLTKLGFDYNFEKFFPRNSADTEFFKQFRKDFESDNDYILVGIVNDSGVFNELFLNKVEKLTQELTELTNVRTVVSPSNVVEYRRYALYPSLVEIPFLHLDDPTQYSTDSIRIFNSKALRGRMFSTSQNAVTILVKHKQLLDNEGCSILAKEVVERVKKYEFDRVHYAGRSKAQTIYIDLIESETVLFVGSSVLLVIIFLIIAYRSFWGVWMPLSVVGLVVLWTMGIMVLTGKQIDLMTNIIPTVLMVIGISAVVHLLTHYLGLRRSGMDREEALIISVREIGFATFLTTVTTMIGFLTLLSSSVKPVVDLGIYGAIGLVFSYIITYTWFPSVLLLHKPILFNRDSGLTNIWNKLLEYIDLFVQKRYRLILIISVILLGVSVIGAFLVKKDNYILDGLKYEHPQRADFRFFNEHFQGARPFEMKLWLADSNRSFFEPEVLKQIESLHVYLEDEYGVGGLISPASIVKSANQVLHGGNVKFYTIPTSENELLKIEKDLYRYNKISTSVYLKRNHSEARLVGNIGDLGSYNMNLLNEDLKAFYESQLDTSLIRYQATGSATLMDINNSYVASNVIEGLLIAIGIIGLIVGWLFRSIKMALISLLPNVVPLVVTAGVMGYFDIDFNLSTSIIFIIAFGVAVDDSIHFLSRFRSALQDQNGNLPAALSITFQTTGKAIIVTTLILSGGFLTLCLSDFLGTFYIGLLVSITLFVALLCDLFLLPAIIVLLWRK